MNVKKIQMQQIFGFVVSFYVVSNMMAQTKFSGIYPIGAFIMISRIMVYSFLPLRLIITSKIKRTELFLLPILIVLIITVSLTSEKTIIIDTFVILLVVRKYDQFKIMWDACRVQFVFWVTTIIASLTGVITNTSIIQAGYSFVRNGLGFNYTTYSANYFFHLVLVYIVIKGSRLNFWRVTVLEAINLFLYIKTNTTAVFVMCGAVIVFAYILRFVNKPIEESGFLKAVFYLVIPASVFTSFYTAINYNPFDKRWVSLNSFLSNRLRLANHALSTYKLSPLGQFIQWNTSLMKSFSNNMAYFYVDSSYINIALVYGWIVLALVCIAFIILMRRGITDDNKMLCLSISFLAMHSIFDPQLIELRYNLLLLCVASVLNFNGIRGLRKEINNHFHNTTRKKLSKISDL